jgi:hypothetical protein
MLDRLARWLRSRLLGAALRASIECVLFDHADELNDDAGTVDANLAELAFVYHRLTGWTPVHEETTDAH